MCLDLEPNAKIQTARKPITVFKIFDGTTTNGYFYSFYQGVPQRKGQLLKSELIVKYNILRERQIVDIGIHSFTSFNIAEKIIMKTWYQMYRSNVGILECVIPKGSKYIKGTFNNEESIASNQLIIIKQIKNQKNV